ncbi:hypothetical protein NLJ89_g5615 [Agrocybe chaxingu]|uniref:Arylamine N-acetyltransferase n=1 Tax=Agrocybe chaxingu TaxID=84603 RepID=A0A9W8K0F2_9AGAR|nr:hypothetical protein NLJ89_g5615 [Agrocybe chaxingu]
MASAYSEKQIDDYVEYIALDPKYHRKANPPKDIAFLSALHAHQISVIPYENLILHYSQDHKVCLDPQTLYKKLTTNGRGGYCMENSIFFNHILRGLGFNAYMAGVRIRPRIEGVPQGDYIGWVHVVNIITLEDGGKYMADVGFGGDGATKPLPLTPGVSTLNIGTQEIRLVHEPLPTRALTSQKFWIYQYRNAPTKPWNSFYAFPELEFLHVDFEIMNYYTGTNPESFQTFTVLVVKFLRDKERGVYGKVMLVNGEVKRNLGGRTEVVKVCKTEEERIAALKEWFGITLTAEETDGIKGMSTELSARRAD